VVLIVLVLLTGPLAYLPDAALAAVVFLIAIELIDLLGMRGILACRKHEFAVASFTAAAVVALGSSTGWCSPSSPRSPNTCGTATARTTASW
jgi:sulfate permease, SulP family